MTKPLAAVDRVGRCVGTWRCSACGHPMRKTGPHCVGFCRCCGAKLTEEERATLSFYGPWRVQPWAKSLNKRLHTLGEWWTYTDELRRVLKSLAAESPTESTER